MKIQSMNTRLKTVPDIAPIELAKGTKRPKK